MFKADKIISIRKIKRKNRLFFASLLAVLSFVSTSCGDKKPTEKEEEPKIVPAPERASEFQILKHDVPDGIGNYFTIKPEDFVNGSLPLDYVSTKKSESLVAKTEEEIASSRGIFLNFPGILFQLSPPSPFTATLSSRGNSQSVNYNINTESNESSKVAISFLTFSQVFPPAFRERYDLTISSYPNAPLAFSYSVSFFVKRVDADPVSINVLPPDAIGKIRFGVDTNQYTVATFIPKIACEDCVIEATVKSLSAQIKTFSELPAVPIRGETRLSQPKRASGLVVSTKTLPLSPIVSGNLSKQVTVSVNLPASLTTVEAWCKGRLDAFCSVPYKGSRVPTYFKFVNAVPEDPAVKMLGGTGGLASLSLGGDIEVSISRSGKLLEKKTITIATPALTPLDQQFLPKWAIDDIRKALLSGAPEFTN